MPIKVYNEKICFLLRLSLARLSNIKVKGVGIDSNICNLGCGVVYITIL